MERDIDILARTLYGEARGEPLDGQIAVGQVIINRYKSGKWYAGKTIADTCLKPWQFSCWNQNDPNCEKIKNLTEKQLVPFKALAGAVIAGMEDMTHGATHYHTQNIRPAWAKGKSPCFSVGHHVFYKGID